VVTGPASPDLAAVDDLAGREVWARRSSSYWASLAALDRRLAAARREPLRLVEADEHLEDEDLLDMLNAGLIPLMRLQNVKLQFDAYHCQIIHGDVTRRLRRLMPIVGHVQIASVPSRNEPDGEELNYPYLFRELDLLDYQGFVGCEYRPRGRTVDGLDWFTDAGGRAG